MLSDDNPAPQFDLDSDPVFDDDAASGFNGKINLSQDDQAAPVFDVADNALLNVEAVPTLADFTAPARRRLQSHLRFLETAPSLQQLETQSPRILETLELVSELPDVLDLTIAVLSQVYEPFERLGLWKEWFPRLFNLYPMLVKSAPSDKLIQWYESAIAHFIYVGKPESAAAAVEGVRDIIKADPKKPSQEAKLNLLRLVVTPVDYAQQSAEILRLVTLTHDRALLARTYGLLAQRCYELNQLRLAFEYAQMAYCIGVVLADPMRIVDGLHWMANVAHVARWEHQTFCYLERALVYNAPTGDVTRAAYLNLSWGAALLHYGHDLKAELHLRNSIDRLQGRGTYFAQALYLHGLALSRLKQFDDAMLQLRSARDEYAAQHCRYETSMSEHALAHLYYLSSQYDEAVTVIEQVVVDLENLVDSVQDSRAAYLLPIVREDAIKYCAERRISASESAPDS